MIPAMHNPVIVRRTNPLTQSELDAMWEDDEQAMKNPRACKCCGKQLMLFVDTAHFSCYDPDCEQYGVKLPVGEHTKGVSDEPTD